MLNCVLLISFYDLVLPKVSFSQNFLFFSFSPLTFFRPSPNPLIISPPQRGGGRNVEQYSGLNDGDDDYNDDEYNYHTFFISVSSISFISLDAARSTGRCPSLLQQSTRAPRSMRHSAMST